MKIEIVKIKLTPSQLVKKWLSFNTYYYCETSQTEEAVLKWGDVSFRVNVDYSNLYVNMQ